MGYDTCTFHIIFGVEISTEDYQRMFLLSDKKRRQCKIIHTPYYLLDGFIALKMTRILIDQEVPWNNKPSVIIPPTPEETQDFLNFLTQHNLDYEIKQYLLP